jgi:hypothetical protein
VSDICQKNAESYKLLTGFDLHIIGQGQQLVLVFPLPFLQFLGQKLKKSCFQGVCIYPFMVKHPNVL